MAVKSKLTYLVDYDDMRKLADGPDKQKIDWLKERTSRYLSAPIQHFIDERYSSFELGVMTLICCGIEAAGHFLAGRKNNKKAKNDFKLFIKSYMKEFSPIVDDLYDYFRCGLAHAFAIECGSIDDHISGLFEREVRVAGRFYKVHPWKLFESFKKGLEAYFKDLESDDEKRKKFIDRFNYSFRFWIENPPE